MRLIGVIAFAAFASCGEGRARSGAGGGAGAQGNGGFAGSAAGAGGAAGGLGAGGATLDATAWETGDAGFPWEFGARAGAAIAAAAPAWTCATSLPTEPVADAAAAHEAVNEFIARVVSVPAMDIAVMVQTCGATMPTTCAIAFAHDTAKSGGAIYDTASPLAQELEANATAIEVAVWTPMQNGLSLQPAATMSGISDGLLVGMVVFNSTYPCH